jgi:hypothetical protein
LKAFPNGIITNKDGLIVGGQQGMDLRDWFAGQVLPKLIGGAGMEEIAEAAYKWADAMMKAREQ